ncbi:exo-beta-1,3-glucanase [Mycena olivaceomarginata]|nr:exo-beta-1,3-glucanase [Mycena olivaceomarginata]
MRVRLSYCAAALSIFIHSARSACAGITGSASASRSILDEQWWLHVASKNAYNPGYKVFRNVKVDYHAVGDGIADDTDAINKAISVAAGKDVFLPITPAIVFFPPGKYRVTKPIIPVGDYNSKPTLIADANFVGTAVIDADPYIDGVSNPDGLGHKWWTNQNNFFRSVRNFVIDVTRMPPINMVTVSVRTGIHWQVGQATSLINIDFKMSSAAGTKHQGIFMENGSGGFMSDLTFDGGAFGMWLSNQQFYNPGFDLNTGGLTLDTQSTGAFLSSTLRSQIPGSDSGCRPPQPNSLASSVVLDNVAFSGISKANIQDSSGTILAASAETVPHWFQGNLYLGSAKRYLRGSYTPSGSRPASLTWRKGDGVTDDTAAINIFLQKYSGCRHLCPKFADQNNPRPVIRVGNPGDIGDVEISDMVITTTGGSAGAIGIEWNIKESTQGSAGLWDVHIRLGGTKFAGHQHQFRQLSHTSTDASKCASVFLGLHITQTGSGYFENVWVWNADHDLDDPNQTQLNVFSGREHHASTPYGLHHSLTAPIQVIYQYAFNNAQNVYAGLIQTETPYFQPTPKPPVPSAIHPTYGDPVDSKLDAWDLIITNSDNILHLRGWAL